MYSCSSSQDTSLILMWRIYQAVDLENENLDLWPFPVICITILSSPSSRRVNAQKCPDMLERRKGKNIFHKWARPLSNFSSLHFIFHLKVIIWKVIICSLHAITIFTCKMNIWIRKMNIWESKINIWISKVNFWKMNILQPRWILTKHDKKLNQTDELFDYGRWIFE